MSATYHVAGSRAAVSSVPQSGWRDLPAGLEALQDGLSAAKPIASVSHDTMGFTSFNPSFSVGRLGSNDPPPLNGC
jgi:hypothetical protein